MSSDAINSYNGYTPVLKPASKLNVNDLTESENKIRKSFSMDKDTLDMLEELKTKFGYSSLSHAMSVFVKLGYNTLQKKDKCREHRKESYRSAIISCLDICAHNYANVRILKSLKLYIADYEQHFDASDSSMFD